MRVLVIGSGAREHALCWTLRRSPQVDLLACLPGNGGTAAIAQNVPLSPTDFAACATWATEQAIDLTIVGPEVPLAGGIVDAFQLRGLRCFGPTSAAARIESSKVWAKAFMLRHAIPTAPARMVTAASLEDAVQSLHNAEAHYPIAVKADGLAAGKGVVIATNAAEAEVALREMIAGQFGAAGAQVLLEEFMTGPEVSCFAICDGAHYRLLGTACDHKRAYDGDTGPNTGGMGAYAPATWLDAATLDAIDQTIIAPTVAGMAAEGVPFTGFLFAGLMITPQGPRVVEFNARFGDPEAQVVLPLLHTPLLDLLEAAIVGRLDALPPIAWEPGAACGVVLAAGEYPLSNAEDLPISGLETLPPAILTFHGGTRLAADHALLAHGGRILTLVGRGPDLATARASVYAAIDQVQFAGARYRHDIGARG